MNVLPVRLALPWAVAGLFLFGACAHSTIASPSAMSALRNVEWKIHLRSSPQVVYELLTTDAGRARFWAETAVERDGRIYFEFINGQRLESRIVERSEPSRFALYYFGTSLTTFSLESDARGGTDLTLREADVPAPEYEGNLAGWVSVLLTLKATADHGVDLRNHDPTRSWDQRYVDP